MRRTSVNRRLWIMTQLYDIIRMALCQQQKFFVLLILHSKQLIIHRITFFTTIFKINIFKAALNDLLRIVKNSENANYTVLAN